MPEEYNDYLMFVGLRVPPLAKEPDAMFAWLTKEEGEQQRVTRVINKDELVTFSLKMKSKLLYCRPGAVYKVTKTDTGVSYQPKSSPVFIADNDQVTSWVAIHRATERDWDAQKRLKNEAKSLPDRELLDPFRHAYNRLNGPAQAQLIADVVGYITRGPTKKP